MSERSWAAAEQAVPELLDALMFMGTVTHGGQVIQQYKHMDTRHYLNLDDSGQAWQIAVHPDTGEIGARRISLHEATALLLS